MSDRLCVCVADDGGGTPVQDELPGSDGGHQSEVRGHTLLMHYIDAHTGQYQVSAVGTFLYAAPCRTRQLNVRYTLKYSNKDFSKQDNKINTTGTWSPLFPVVVA